MTNIIWRLWLSLSGQTYPTFRGHTLRNPFGAVYTYYPEEMWAAWADARGKFAGYGKWPPLVGRG